MALPPFKSFFPTVASWRSVTGLRESSLRLLFDTVSGAPVGIQSQADNSPDGIWAPTPLTAAQIASPTPAMLADLNATFQLNVPPYTRYQSDGSQLVALGGESLDGSTLPGSILQTVPAGSPRLTIGASSYAYIYSPFTVQNAAGVAVLGRLDVVSRPA